MKLQNKKYSFWELLQKVGIKIPIIQRDYAQGRKNQKVQFVRENFLNTIHEALLNYQPIDLDFIYGTLKNDYLIPLDGQQRLTTLFLLHFYLALKDSKDNKLTQDIKNILLKFTYETRLSSREFCRNIIEKQITLEINRHISDIIKDQSWFLSSWQNDPTISSMLIMLDSIQNKFTEDSLFNLLTKINEDNKLITFSFLDLDDFHLTDQLYVKMNARGKPLSEFENFKSKYESFLKDERVKAKLDNEWFDIFWRLNASDVKKTDSLFLNFFKNTTAFYSDKFNDVDIFSFAYTNRILKNIEKILNFLEYYNDDIFERKIFFDFIHIDPQKPEYEKRLRFYSLMQFIFKFGQLEHNDRIFASWIRVILNILDNTIFNKIDDYEKSKLFIERLAEILDGDFYRNLSESTLLDTDQFNEEKYKAALIIEDKNNDWENQFIKFEQNWYLGAEIKFLIDFSNKEIGAFKAYGNRFVQLWDFAKHNDFNKYLIQRALLTIEDDNLSYLQKTCHNNGNRYTFCTFGTTLREKNENWRRVFNSPIFKKFLTHKIDIDNIEESLSNMIDNYKFDYCDWKSVIINPKKDWTILDKIRNMQIQYSKDGIYLNRGGTSVTSWGWYSVSELYTYYLYRLLKYDLQILSEPFEELKYYVSSSYEPCFYLFNWKYKEYNFNVDVSYKDDKFLIDFYDHNEKSLFQIEDILKKLLKKYNFRLDETYYVNDSELDLNNINDLISMLKSFLSECSEINESI
ncbi:DUF262 domain-containing protein [Aliarcobacter cryaerophilus]|uniref:DUF262 domain-containing protein n=1 Tax=Aliarcobacter cryaerophilus TaxID=28198 RepID=UPI0021B67D16|nr:DUF262 domain-containing protein [Aliarcobacter cryaerophilus]MCT7519177.1 DUF262 domain-containing protein [Aliarcobacter cryaerophilus]